MKIKLFSTAFLVFLLSTITIIAAETETKSLPVYGIMKPFTPEIHYGDVIFACVNIQNDYNSKILSYLDQTPYDISAVLRSDKGNAYVWKTPPKLNDNEFEFPHILGFNPSRRLRCREEVESKQNGSFMVRLFWLPMPEFREDEYTKGIQDAIASGKQEFTLELKSQLIVTEAEPEVEFDKAPRKSIQLNCKITVKPRSQKTLNLLQEWFLELPTSADMMWQEKFMFCHPFYARSSPYDTKIHSLQERNTKRGPHYDGMRTFFTSLKTRTPEVEKRIKKTNELASELLKLPDSELSTNMKEFIQLRGFLVDMRYAEDGDAEKAAFDGLCTWLESTHDKELWVKLLNEIGFDSIFHHEYFLWPKVERYKKQFQEFAATLK